MPNDGDEDMIPDKSPTIQGSKSVNDEDIKDAMEDIEMPAESMGKFSVIEICRGSQTAAIRSRHRHGCEQLTEPRGAQITQESECSCITPRVFCQPPVSRRSFRDD